MWVMEGVRGGKYRMISRVSPDYTGNVPAFRVACEKFIELAGPEVAASRRR
jgi:hypothetical protein